MCLSNLIILPLPLQMVLDPLQMVMQKMDSQPAGSCSTRHGFVTSSCSTEIAHTETDVTMLTATQTCEKKGA